MDTMKHMLIKKCNKKTLKTRTFIINQFKLLKCNIYIEMKKEKENQDKTSTEI